MQVDNRAGKESQPDIDVAIVGAGIAGLSMAGHIGKLCPGRSYAIFERRARIGGTWDLFRYPGVRSDSDMYTLGFAFEPWRDDKAIAAGDAILGYLDSMADKRAIRRNIRFGTQVIAADWDSPSARWVLTVESEDGGREQVTARWLYLGTGYYDYDQPYDAPIPGKETFAGDLLHPQFWPQDYDWTGKRVVVIGSGATAVTVVPAMAAKAAHVTMLQRTPTWYLIQPTRDRLANLVRKLLPERLAYKAIRFRNTRLQDLLFSRSRAKPAAVGAWLTKGIRRALGERYDAKAFTPPYNPWEQRLCLVPDGDFFQAINSGKASVVTDRIVQIDAGGVALESGARVDADTIVTATGLKVSLLGKIAVSRDGVPVNPADHFWYKGCMLSNIPNLSVVFGYLNASWTLRADLDADYVCRVLRTMAVYDAKVAVPVLPADHALTVDTDHGFSSGYILRGGRLLPKSATDMRWRLNQDYLADKKWMAADPVEDGTLRFDG